MHTVTVPDNLVLPRSITAFEDDAAGRLGTVPADHIGNA